MVGKVPRVQRCKDLKRCSLVFTYIAADVYISVEIVNVADVFSYFALTYWSLFAYDTFQDHWSASY